MSQHFFYPLSTVVKPYPWGSRSALHQRFHVPNPDAQPQAELWMGVHPAGMSQVMDQGTPLALSELIARDRKGMLGAATAARFGDLPYLMKILAADRALSIQVHPQKAQAEAGYARALRANEDIPDYNDANHKPELVYAITPFIAMNGFRDIADIVENFRLLAVTALSPAVDALAQQPDAVGLKVFFSTLMQLSADAKAAALKRVVSAPFDDALMAVIQQLYQHYPHDAGVLAPLYLHCITLQPGEAMFLYPGTLHAYVQGTAVEIMASSDNVLRAGLTDKKINVEELIACTTFSPISRTSLLMEPEWQEGQAHYPIPIDDFRFTVLNANEALPMQTRSAEIVLVMTGSATLTHHAGDTLTLQTGQSAFIPAATQNWTLTNTGTLCRAYS